MSIIEFKGSWQARIAEICEIIYKSHISIGIYCIDDIVTNSINVDVSSNAENALRWHGHTFQA